MVQSNKINLKKLDKTHKYINVMSKEKKVKILTSKKKTLSEKEKKQSGKKLNS